MPITTSITAQNVQRLKQKARQLKRESELSHTEALEKVALELGFNHWHHVVKSHENILPAETALKEGYVVAYDFKDGMEISGSDGTLIENSLFELLLQQE